jgi:hypothetical protein
MAQDPVAQKGELAVVGNTADALTTEARVLAYLRAAMLEFGDDPRAMAVAISNVEIARARLQRKGPLRIDAAPLELARPVTKLSR